METGTTDPNKDFDRQAFNEKLSRLAAKRNAAKPGTEFDAADRELDAHFDSDPEGGYYTT